MSHHAYAFGLNIVNGIHNFESILHNQTYQHYNFLYGVILAYLSNRQSNECLIWGFGLSHQLPPRVSSDESSPDGVKGDVKKKKTEADKTKKDKQKKEDKQKKNKKAKNNKTDEDDDDDQPDQEHDALPAGSDDDDDNDPEFGLEGLNELLDIGGGKSDGKKISKKPATKGGAKKRPSTKKRDEAPNIVVWNEYNKSTLTYVI